MSRRQDGAPDVQINNRLDGVRDDESVKGHHRQPDNAILTRMTISAACCSNFVLLLLLLLLLSCVSISGYVGSLLELVHGQHGQQLATRLRHFSGWKLPSDW